MLQSFKLAIKSIIANKMRSFLTMLGLIIGVSAVVILVSVMMGYLNNMVKSFMDMGANTISVSLVNTPARQASIDQMYDFFKQKFNFDDKVIAIFQDIRKYYFFCFFCYINKLFG